MIQLRARSWFKTLHHPKGPSNSMSPSSDSRSWSSKLKSQVLRGHRPGGYCFEALLGNQFFLQFLLQALRLSYALFISVSSFALPRNLSTTISPHPGKYSDLEPFRCTVPFSLNSVRYFSQNDQFRSALAQLLGQVPLRFRGSGAAVHSFRFPRSSAAKSQCMCSVAHIFK